MTSVLNSYLVQHKSLSIPGLGTVYIEEQPAHHAEGSNQWLPPAFVYRFDKFHDTPAKEFFHFVAERKKMPEYEAIKWYNELAAAFRSDIKMKEEARWEEVGIFKKDDSGEIIFEQLSKPFTLFEPIEAEEITRSLEPVQVAQEETVTVPDPAIEAPVTPAAAKKLWWIYAVVLFAVIIIVLSIHFYNRGLIWRAFFNQQPVF